MSFCHLELPYGPSIQMKTISLEVSKHLMTKTVSRMFHGASLSQTCHVVFTFTPLPALSASSVVPAPLVLVDIFKLMDYFEVHSQVFP